MHKLAFILLIVGGLNWLAFGLLGTEIGGLLGGMDSMVSRIIYILVGVAAVFELFTHKRACRDCGTKAGSSSM